MGSRLTPALPDPIFKQKTVIKKINGTPVEILSLPSLIKMKRAAAQPQDFEDVRTLQRLKARAKSLHTPVSCSRSKQPA